VTTTLSPRT